MSKQPRDKSGKNVPLSDALDDSFYPPSISDDGIDEQARRDREARLARDRAALENPRVHRVHDMKYADKQPRKGRAARHDDEPFPDHLPDHLGEDGLPLPRSLSDKMFGISFWGWVRLGVLCLTAGAIFEAGGFNPFAPAFTWSSVPAELLQGVINVFTWSVGTAWRPLLLGAVAIIPIWLVWRLITVPFRH
jgi:hypothetical protein